jgi:preprotein translocase subunit SecD
MRKRSRFIIIAAVLAVCFLFLWPSINWHFRTPKEVQSLALGSLEHIKDYSVSMAWSQASGLRAQARADTNAPVPRGYSWLEKSAKKNYRLLKKPAPKPMTLYGALESYGSIEELRAEIEQRHRDQIIKAKNLYANSVKLGLDLSGGMSVIVKADLNAAYAQNSQAEAGVPEQQFRQEAMAQAIETLRSRIDRFGLTEPVIRQQGEDHIYIELPGAAEADAINSIIMGKGILNFRLVDMAATDSFNTAYRQNPTDVFNASGELLNKSLIPADCEVFGYYDKDSYGLDERRSFYVVKKEIALDGKYVQSAEVSRNSTNMRTEVNFRLDSEGAQVFGDFTGAHVHDYLAIVSNDQIKSVAEIQGAITGGQVALSGSFTVEEAQNIKKVLQTAWLSVPLTMESQQVIGASLGETAVQQGLRAVTMGLLAVMAFMLVLYLVSGINAVVAQVLNLYIMFSILSALNLTLTLPSIAGMILTIGMAVDANVIIFERIKEELRLGKGRAAAIATGFDNAFWAIMDANITTFIAAIFMSQLGQGSIQGFAVSLAIGVVSSVFTALVVSRLIFDVGTQVFKQTRISISWRIK